MLSHGFECHLYANDFHIFISSLTTLLNSGFRAPSVFPNIFIGCLIKQLRLQKSKTELWLSTPATASAPFPVSLSGNSCPPGAQPKIPRVTFDPLFKFHAAFPPQAHFADSTFTLHSEFSYFHHILYTITLVWTTIIFLDYCNNLLTNFLVFSFASISYTPKQICPFKCPSLA